MLHRSINNTDSFLLDIFTEISSLLNADFIKIMSFIIIKDILWNFQV